MNEQQLAAVKQALEALKKGAGWMEHGEAINALQSIISQESAPAPVQSLQCAHCQVTIDTLNDKAMYLIDENQRLRAELKFNTTPAAQPALSPMHASGLVAIKTLLSLDPEAHAALVLDMIDEMLKENK